MTLLHIITRKMLNNRWLVGSLFLGLLITVALVSSIPTYTSGILQKMLVKDMVDYQVKNNKYPGEVSMSVRFAEPGNHTEEMDQIDSYFQSQIDEIGAESSIKTKILSTEPYEFGFRDTEKHASSASKDYGRIMTIQDIEDHIEITDGKLPSDKPVDDVYEVIVTESALQERNMVLNTELEIDIGDDSVIVKPVGTFVQKDLRDPFWLASPDTYRHDFIVLYDLFLEDFVSDDLALLQNVQFYHALDYHSFKFNRVEEIKALEDNLQKFVAEDIEKDTLVLTNFPAKNILTQYGEKNEQVIVMLWSLNVPLLIMLAIYLFMVARLIVERQVNEIAVLKSRGAKTIQVFFIYLTEISILGLIALLIGPYLGLGLSQMLGATNGFLNFVQRSSLDLSVTFESYQYALLAVIASIVMIMIPVLQASKQTIVSHKRNLARVGGMALWHKLFLDVILLGVAWYGWSLYQDRQQELLTLAGEEDLLTIDPLLFFVPAVFVIGFGLLCLRIYPWLILLIYKIGRKFWSVSLYTTMLQVSRSSKQYQFLMLFLVMTIATGVFSASAARTINKNLEEQIRYSTGADVDLRVRWESHEVQYDPVVEVEANEDGETPTGGTDIVYTEPSFQPYEELEGVETATKVFTKGNLSVAADGKYSYTADLMAIEPKKFGEATWFKPSLLDHHWYEYLNLIAQEPSSVIISETLAKRLSVKTGDYLTLEWNGSEKSEVIVYGIVEYWPTFNPNLKTTNGELQEIVVANLPYIQNTMGLEPYNVWLKMKPDASRNDLYRDIDEKDLPILGFKDAYSEIVEMKNGAFLLGLNGTLSLGFIISMLITFIGFLLYWILSLKARVLQYGIFRAIGIPLPQLIGILVWEQLFTSGFASLLGIVIGGITSRFFVPLFQLTFDAEEKMPPFEVIIDRQDELQIYVFVFFMLLVGLGILVALLRRIRIHQAIKLGED